MLNPIYKNLFSLIIYSIKRPVIAYSNPVAFFVGKLNGAVRARIGGQTQNRVFYIIKNLVLQLIKVFLSFRENF